MFDNFLKQFEIDHLMVLEEALENISEKAPPGMEDWIKKNKKRFQKEYGKEKGLEVLYATAWKRHNANEEKNNDGVKLNENLNINEAFNGALKRAANKVIDLIEKRADNDGLDIYDAYVIYGDEIADRVIYNFNRAYDHKYGAGWDSEAFDRLVRSMLDDVIYSEPVEEEINDAGGRYATMDTDPEGYLKGQRFVG